MRKLEKNSQEYCKDLKLSPREIQCLRCAFEDKTIKETSRALQVSTETVISFRKKIFRKLNTKTINGAIGVAMMMGVFE